jgi:hypothetical protein
MGCPLALYLSVWSEKLTQEQGFAMVGKSVEGKSFGGPANFFGRSFVNDVRRMAERWQEKRKESL